MRLALTPRDEHVGLGRRCGRAAACGHAGVKLQEQLAQGFATSATSSPSHRGEQQEGGRPAKNATPGPWTQGRL